MGFELSDADVQFCDLSIKYIERLAEADIEPAVGSVGDLYDNALAETVNGLFEAEVIHRRNRHRWLAAALNNMTKPLECD